jgi:hypothetical protein
MIEIKTMNKMKLIFSIAIIFTIYSGYSQTIVSGGIYTNTTWTAANSPYLMTGSIVVFPGVTLAIEPGVEVRVKENGFTGDQFYLETRGTINMIGEPGALITFRADTAITSTYAWTGILVKNSQGGVLNYNYVSISNALYAITYDAFVPPVINLNDCVFNYNGYAVTVGTEVNAENCTFKGNNSAFYGWSIFRFYNCVFDSNQAALPIYASELIIEDCSFTDNWLGINLSSGAFTGISVKNTVFENNVVAFDNANNGLIDSCTFINNGEALKNTNTLAIKNSLFTNNQTALQVGWGTTIMDCEINENETGVALGPIGFGQPAPIIENNNICYNTSYNIDNRTDLNLFIPTNCFCITDSAEIEEKILDGYDDITKGLISYAIYDTTCTTITMMVNKFMLTSTEKTIDETELSVFPNPCVSELNVNNDKSYEYLEILDMQGQLKLTSKLTAGNNQLNISSMQAGVYFLRFTGEGLNTWFTQIIKK